MFPYAKGFRKGSSFSNLAAGLATLGSTALLLFLGVFGVTCSRAQAPQDSFVLHHQDGTIVLQPYRPNIVRITLSKDAAQAQAPTGYGIIAHPAAEGWSQAGDSAGEQVFRSAQLVVRFSAGPLPESKAPGPMPLDGLNEQLRAQHFGAPHGGPNLDRIRVETATGKIWQLRRRFRAVRALV